MRRLTLFLILLFILPCVAGDKWGRDGSWGREQGVWGRGITNTPIYSTFLIKTAANPGHAHDVTYDARGATYSLEAAAARAELVADGWTITDGGCELGANLEYFWRGDFGITGAVNPTQWTDMIAGEDADVAGAGADLTLGTIGGQVAIVGHNAKYLQTALFGSALDQPYSIWMVVKTSTNEGVTKAMISGKAHAVDVLDSWGAPADYVVRLTNILNSAGAGEIVAGREEYRLLVIEESANVDKLYVNGTQVITGNAGAGTLDGLTMFALNTGLNAADGSIAEIGILSTPTITAGQKTILNTYIEARYGLDVTP
jgi:hypothetical protein